MEKFLLNVLQMFIVVRVGYSLLRWMLFTKKKSKKSIANKIMRLATNKIHYRLDNALKTQKKVLSTKQKDVAYPTNVIPLRKTK